MASREIAEQRVILQDCSCARLHAAAQRCQFDQLVVGGVDFDGAVFVREGEPRHAALAEEEAVEWIAGRVGRRVRAILAYAAEIEREDVFAVGGLAGAAHAAGLAVVVGENHLVAWSKGRHAFADLLDWSQVSPFRGAGSWTSSLSGFTCACRLVP